MTDSYSPDGLTCIMCPGDYQARYTGAASIDDCVGKISWQVQVQSLLHPVNAYLQITPLKMFTNIWGKFVIFYANTHTIQCSLCQINKWNLITVTSFYITMEFFDWILTMKWVLLISNNVHYFCFTQKVKYKISIWYHAFSMYNTSFLIHRY